MRRSEAKSTEQICSSSVFDAGLIRINSFHVQKKRSGFEGVSCKRGWRGGGGEMIMLTAWTLEQTEAECYAVWCG